MDIIGIIFPSLLRLAKFNKTFSAAEKNAQKYTHCAIMSNMYMRLNFKKTEI